MNKKKKKKKKREKILIFVKLQFLEFNITNANIPRKNR